MSATFYSVAGVSTRNGQQTVRYGNSLSRARVLAANGHTLIRLVEMPYQGRVEDCVNHLLSLPEFRELPCVVEEARKLGFRV